MEFLTIARYSYFSELPPSTDACAAYTQPKGMSSLSIWGQRQSIQKRLNQMQYTLIWLYSTSTRTYSKMLRDMNTVLAECMSDLSYHEYSSGITSSFKRELPHRAWDPLQYLRTLMSHDCTTWHWNCIWKALSRLHSKCYAKASPSNKLHCNGIFVYFPTMLHPLNGKWAYMMKKEGIVPLLNYKPNIDHAIIFWYRLSEQNDWHIAPEYIRHEYKNWKMRQNTVMILKIHSMYGDTLTEVSERSRASRTVRLDNSWQWGRDWSSKWWISNAYNLSAIRWRA